MAGDWIKIRKCLFSHPKVMRISAATGICEEAVVGWLTKLWAWADDVTADGHVPGVTAGDVVRVVGIPTKVLACLQEVGWFVQDSEGVCFPDYEENMSESAKKRALGMKRAQKNRENTGKSGCNADVTHAALRERYESVTRGRGEEEERREEYISSNIDIDDSTIDFSLVFSRADAICDTLGHPSAADRTLAWRVAYLVTAGIYSEHWMCDAIEAVTRGEPKGNRWAYFSRCLATMAREAFGRDFTQDCRAVPRRPHRSPEHG